jgi:hypothetical protein
MRVKKILTLVLILVAIVSFSGLFTVAIAQVSAQQNFQSPSAKFTKAVAFDVSAPLRSMQSVVTPSTLTSTLLQEIRPERGPDVKDQGHSRDGALQVTSGRLQGAVPAIPAPLLTFEGVSNEANFNLFGFRVAPPDPDGDVGPNHYVEIVNLAFAVYDKQGNKLLGPVDTGSLWQGFSIPDCTDPSGDPIVLYDQLEDRWLLSQFTTRGPIYYNCVAISQTGDPTGAYFRYAFSAGPFFPDYPKYGVWRKSYVLTSRDFGNDGSYGISVYALEKNKMIAGNPNARAVHFFLDSAVVGLNLVGDGLLPADIDGARQPKDDAAIPVIGTQDDGGGYGGPSDALNVWELSIKWQFSPVAAIAFRGSLPVDSFDSIFPCGVVPGSQPPSARDCLPEPGVTDGSRYLDILSYRQRPTWRLAYRNFGGYETMVTNQSVEALPGVAGVRWYEIRRTNGQYSVFQQGTYAPNDGVHRWMGSIAMDHKGNMALGYSVVNGVDVRPGIRYTGRLAGDAAGQMTLGEGTVIDGTGVQLTTSSRWGDYTSMNVDPTDDCTFWYVNEYYQVDGVIGVNTAPWQTRIGSFRLPGCGGQ